jgi:LysM repeat protein
MKVTQIFGLVLLFHVVAIGLILFQPGCQSRTPPPPPPPGAQTAQTSTPNSDTAKDTTTRATYVSPSSLEAPTRPTGSNSNFGGSSTSARGSQTLDPAFNAGLGAGSGLNEPKLEPSVDLSRGDTVGPADGGPTQTYTVIPGDNLTRIARSYGVTVDDLKRANGLNSSVIHVGDVLTIPATSAPVSTVTADAAGSETYKVQSGDSLSRIASRFNVTVSELKAANNLSSDLIKVNDVLYIPTSTGAVRSSSRSSGSSSSSSASSAAAASGNTYTVQSGDTPSGIAKRFGLDYRELMRANGITNAKGLQVGQVLIIPGGGNSSASSASGPTLTPPASIRSTNAATTRPTPPPTSQPTRPATLTPRTSQPTTIGTDDASSQGAASDLELLEGDDLPLLDVEVVEDPEGGQ